MYISKRGGFVAAAAFWFSFTADGGAQAAVIQVPSQQLTIQRAVNAAKSGDEIVVAPGTYLEMVNVFGKSVTIRGSNPSMPPSVISFYLVNATGGVLLRNIKLGGNGPGYPIHSVTSDRTELTVDNCIARGGIRIFNASSLQITDTEILERISVEGVSAENVATVTIADSLIEGGPGYDGTCNGTLQTQPQSGSAGLLVRGSRTVSISNSVITGGDGGALFPGEECASSEPVIAEGGHGIVLDAVKTGYVRNVEKDGGTGLPEGQDIVLLNGSWLSDDTMSGFALY